jgi:hypothetical protein
MGSPAKTSDPVRDLVVARAELRTIQAIDRFDPDGALAYRLDVAMPSASEAAYHQRLILAAAKNGIVDPANALAAAEYSATNFSVVCTSLLMESYGGKNMWGGDPGGYALPSYLFEQPVTPHDFLEVYWPRASAGDTPNGCGGGQLTSYGLQLAAQKIGGCYLDGPNYKVAAILMRQLLQEYGSVQRAFEAYNGSGAAAVAYGWKAAGIEAELHAKFLACR